MHCQWISMNCQLRLEGISMHVQWNFDWFSMAFGRSLNFVWKKLQLIWHGFQCIVDGFQCNLDGFPMRFECIFYWYGMESNRFQWILDGFSMHFARVFNWFWKEFQLDKEWISMLLDGFQSDLHGFPMHFEWIWIDFEWIQMIFNGTGMIRVPVFPIVSAWFHWFVLFLFIGFAIALACFHCACSVSTL